MHFRLTAVETPPTYAVESVSRQGRIKRLKVFPADSQGYKDAILLTHKLNTERR